MSVTRSWRYVDEIKKLEHDADTLQEIAEHWGERFADQVRLTQRWKAAAQRAPATVRVKGDTVYAPPEIVEVDAPCTVYDPQMEGTCEGEVYEVGGKPAARVFWSGLATFGVGDKLYEIDSGEPRLATVIDFEREVPPRLRRSLLTLRAGVSTAPGVTVGGSLWRGTRRLGYWGQIGYDWDPDTLSGYQDTPFNYEADRWRVAGGVAWRLGG
jgi:hypothetical protein